MIITFGSLCWRFSLTPNNSSSAERRMSDSESSCFSVLIFRYRTLTLFKWLGSTVWPLRLLRLIRKLSVTQNISAWQTEEKCSIFFQLRTVFSYVITLHTKLQLLRMILHSEEESHKYFIRTCFLDLQGSRSHLFWRRTDRRSTLPWGSRFLQNRGCQPNYMKSHTRWP